MLVLDRWRFIGWLSTLEHGGFASSFGTSLLHALELLLLKASLRSRLNVPKVIGSCSALGEIRLKCQLIFILFVLVVFLALIVGINLSSPSIIKLLDNFFSFRPRLVVISMFGDSIKIDGADAGPLFWLSSPRLSFTVDVGCEGVLFAELSLLL